MKQYKFTVQGKLKYIKIAESKCLKNPILHFEEELKTNQKVKTRIKNECCIYMLIIW